MGLLNVDRETIISCLKELGDEEFQWRVWIRGEGPEVSSGVECVCRLFDDTTLGDLLDSRKDDVVIASNVDNALRELSELIDKVDMTNEEKLLANSRWAEVRKLAHSILDMIPKSWAGPAGL